MEFLLVFLLFDTTNGQLLGKRLVTVPYGDEASCNQAGRTMSQKLEYPKDSSVRSLSVCISRAAFDQPGDYAIEPPAPKPRDAGPQPRA